jgi:hypothetical protein
VSLNRNGGTSEARSGVTASHKQVTGTSQAYVQVLAYKLLNRFRQRCCVALQSFMGLSNANTGPRVFLIGTCIRTVTYVLCDNRDKNLDKSMISRNIVSHSKIMVEQRFFLMGND